MNFLTVTVEIDLEDVVLDVLDGVGEVWVTSAVSRV